MPIDGMLMLMDTIHGSHDVEEALRREEEALLAAAAALDEGSDVPLKPRLEQPRRSALRERCVFLSGWSFVIVSIRIVGSTYT